MTYTEIPVTSSTSPAIGELWAAQPIDTPANSAILFAQPSQDIWVLNLSTGVAAEIRNGFGPQTASMRWDGTSHGETIFAAFPKTPNRMNLRGGGRQIQRVNLDGSDGGRTGFSGGETSDVVESKAMAGIQGGDAYLWTASNLYRIARNTADGELNLTLVGPHGVRGITAAAYWPAQQRFIICVRDRLFFYDPADRSAQEIRSATPVGTRGLFVAGGRLYAVAERSLARFDNATLVPLTAQAVIETDRWEWRLRSRKTHEILATLADEELVEGRFTWNATEMGGGELVLAADEFVERNAEWLNEMAFPSADIGGVDIELYREAPGLSRPDQGLGVVKQIRLQRGATTNISTINVGDIENNYIVLGGRTTGSGGAECRLIEEVGDPFLIAARGLHDGTPVDARGELRRSGLQSLGRARVERSLRRLKVDENVDFNRSQRVDRIYIYFDDPWTYLKRRYSNPGLDDAKSYGGLTAGDYIGNMVRDELRLNPPGFNPQRHLDRRLDVVWEAVFPSIGNRFDVEYVRTRLLRILEDACFAGGVILDYRLGTTNVLMLGVRQIRDRSFGEGRVVLVDGRESIDPDSVLPGDRVERELLVGDIAVGGAGEREIRSFSVPSNCGEADAAAILSSPSADAGILITSRQVAFDGNRGIQTKLGSGFRGNREEQLLDLGNAARIG